MTDTKSSCPCGCEFVSVDDTDTRIHEMIAKRAWASIAIGDARPPYVYTVGLTRIDLPELYVSTLVSGLLPKAYRWLENIVEPALVGDLKLVDGQQIMNDDTGELFHLHADQKLLKKMNLVRRYYGADVPRVLRVEKAEVPYGT